MKPTMSLSLCFVIFFVYLFPTSKGLQCYHCEYNPILKTGETCNEGKIPDKKYLTQCSENENVCGTQVITLNDLKNVERVCTSAPLNKIGCHDAQKSEGSVKASIRTCICSTDKCNSGALLIIQHFTWALAVLASFLGKKVLT